MSHFTDRLAHTLRALSAILPLFMPLSGAGAYEPPTMGWSSWNTYRNLIHDTLIRQQADALVRLGLRDAGYDHVNIDDGAFDGRTPGGQLHPHTSRFPDGLKPVVDYIHSLGLKAGTYSDAGRNTCAHFWDHDKGGAGIGLYGHEEQDADYLFKKLGFDFIKVDFCGGDVKQNAEKLTLDDQERYTAIHRAILKTGRRDVRMNVCRWAYPGHWARNVATSWRISGDISNTWASVKRIVAENTVALSRLALKSVAEIRDVYDRKNLPLPAGDNLTVSLPPHATRIYLLTGRPIEQQRYEAENAWLAHYSAIREGDFARPQLAPGFSCGAKVCQLGGKACPDNFMEWRDVFSQSGGRYSLTIAYACEDPRPLTVSVNGQPAATFTALTSNGNGTTATVTLAAELRAGHNTVRLSAPSDWAPDIDYMDVVKAD